MTVKFTIFSTQGLRMDTRRVKDYTELESVRNELKQQPGTYAVDWH